jgi:peptide-methionine (S)-S-oxide reductase
LRVFVFGGRAVDATEFSRRMSGTEAPERWRALRSAVEAIQNGDVARLESLLDAEPLLLHDRIVEPDAYPNARRYPYFLEPKLVWFVANNPTLAERMPANIVDVARAMIARGVEQTDLDYTLALVMTSSVAREQGRQRPLMRMLLDAGAVPTGESILSTAGHAERDALRALREYGIPTTATIAAALGEDATLRELLADADARTVQEAFAVAVINGHTTAARIALDAGADVDLFLPVHAHSTALHQAALGENVGLIDLLLERGARLDTCDKLWDATPLGWAIHQDRPIARARLERAAAR